MKCLAVDSPLERKALQWWQIHSQCCRYLKNANILITHPSSLYTYTALYPYLQQAQKLVSVSPRDTHIA